MKTKSGEKTEKQDCGSYESEGSLQSRTVRKYETNTDTPVRRQMRGMSYQSEEEQKSGGRFDGAKIFLTLQRVQKRETNSCLKNV